MSEAGLTDMDLRVLLPELNPAPPALDVGQIELDSARVQPGGLFIALRGTRRHGLQFLDDALARGATAVAWEPAAGVELPALPGGVVGLRVPHLRARLGDIANRFFGEPSRRLHVHGITGTNGKTTAAWLVVQAFAALGRRPAYLGTLGSGLGGRLQADALTTPDCLSFHRLLREFADARADTAVTEVSSHALDQGRVDGVYFRVAAFTNLTRDHLDYHGDLASYGRAKRRLFLDCAPAIAVVNIGDSFGEDLARRIAGGPQLIRAAAGDAPPPADDEVLYVRRLGVLADGQRLQMSWHGALAECVTALPGAFNAENIAVAAGMLAAEGFELGRIAATLARGRAPPGRMERITGAAGRPAVFVDFAHTPDALARALRTLRGVTAGRLWCVFGCGGNRDQGKRPLMGTVASRGADVVVLTDDNPRDEDPAAIVQEILAGFPAGSEPQVLHDRAAAIRHAIHSAGPTDVVLIAGKGHETSQVSGGQALPFSDQDAARAALAGAP